MDVPVTPFHAPVAVVEQVFSAGWAGALFFLAVWLLVGGFIVLTATRILRGHAERTSNAWDDVVSRSMKSPLLFLLVLAGLYLFTTRFGLFSPLWEQRVLLALAILLAVAIAHTASRVAVVILDRSAERHPAFQPMEGMLEFILRLGFYSVAILIVLDHAGVTITPLLGALGIGALAIALALQDTLAQFFAGIYLALDRPMREGDYLELDGGGMGNIKGYVISTGWRSVRIRELGNNIFVLPNSRLASGIIKNYDLPDREVSVLVQCSVAYDSDLEHVERATVEVATRCQEELPGAVRTHEPFIRFHTFGSDGIGFAVILRASTFVDQYLLTHEFVKALHRRFDEEEIEIPFPQRTLHLDDPAREAVAQRASGGASGAPGRT